MKKDIRARIAMVVGLALTVPLGSEAQVVTGQPAAPEDQYQVGTAQPPRDAGRSMVGMSLEGALARALEVNLDIQSMRLNPRIQSFSLSAARAAFAPTLSATVGQNNQSTQSTSQLDGGARISTERQTLNLSLGQTVPWYGGRLTANFNNGRTVTDNSFSTRNPSYNSTFSFNYNQPLLSGFRTDNLRTALRTQEIQSQITDLQVLSRIANTVNQVRVAYWGLRATIEQIEIQRRSLAQGQQLLEQNRVSVRLGRMADIQVVQAEAQVASAEQALLNAEIQWRNQEFNLKRLLVAGADDPLFQQTINPTDLPTVVQQAPDIQGAIQKALSERTDINQQRQEKNVSELNLEVTKQGSRPDVSLTAGYSLQGVGGNLFSRSELGGDPVLVQQGGYFDALNAISGFDTPTWNVSLNASYPIGMRQGKANLERAKLQLQQADLALRSQELAIVTQVTNAGLAVSNTFLQVEAARRSRAASERSLDAVLQRFAVGVATNLEVVTAQNALTTARLSELRSTIDHVNAVAEFERVQRVGG